LFQIFFCRFVFSVALCGLAKFGNGIAGFALVTPDKAEVIVRPAVAVRIECNGALILQIGGFQIVFSWFFGEDVTETGTQHRKLLRIRRVLNGGTVFGKSCIGVALL